MQKEALEGIDRISQDLFELSGRAEETFRGWAELPNLVMATPSRAQKVRWQG